MAKKRGHGEGSLYQRGGKGCWHVSYYDENGKRRQKNTRTTDKKAAARIVAKLVADVALRREGVVDATQERMAGEGRKPLVAHIEAYITHCRDAAGQAERHVIQKDRHLRRLVDATGIDRLADLSADVMEAHMRGLRAEGLSARTANFARQIAVAFCNWCVNTGRLPANPLAVVPKLDIDRDRRRVRRPLTDEELSRLLDVAAERGRALWYLCAALAGLRRGDMTRLRWRDIDLQAGTLTVRGGKSRRVDVLPLHPQLWQALEERQRTNPALPEAKVFPTAVTDQTRQKDFLRAGLAKREPVRDDDGNIVMTGKGKRQRPKTRIVAEDSQGRVIDLHALRTTLGTQLARAGVAPQVAQRIMRHSDYKTTLKHYTVLGLTDTRQAVDDLPGIEPTQRNRQAATGTTDATPGENDCSKTAAKQQQKRRNPAHTGAQRSNGQEKGTDKARGTKPSIHAGKRDVAHLGAQSCNKAGEGTRTLNNQLGRLTL